MFLFLRSNPFGMSIPFGRANLLVSRHVFIFEGEPFGRANLLVSRHVFIFDGDPVREGEPPGEPACIHLRREIRIRNRRIMNNIILKK